MEYIKAIEFDASEDLPNLTARNCVLYALNNIDVPPRMRTQTAAISQYKAGFDQYLQSLFAFCITLQTRALYYDGFEILYVDQVMVRVASRLILGLLDG
jgi:hypothetical protein